MAKCLEEAAGDGVEDVRMSARVQNFELTLERMVCLGWFKAAGYPFYVAR